MKFEVLSTIVIDTQAYPYHDGEFDLERPEEEVLEFTFKTNDLAKIIFRGGPNKLRVDDKILCILESGGITFTSKEKIWMVKNSRQFFSDCIDAYTKARYFETVVN